MKSSTILLRSLQRR